MQRRRCTGSFTQGVAGTMGLWRECSHFIKLRNTTSVYLKGAYVSYLLQHSIGHLIITTLTFWYSGGVPIRYGAPEPWKTKAATLGHTKPSRAPNPEEKRRKKNDGRPPDTIKELFGRQNNKKFLREKPAPKISPKPRPDFGLPAYPWNNNSCWLDASLQLLYMAVTNDFNEFETVCRPLDPEFALGALYSIFRDRFYLDLEKENVSTILESQRDLLRVFLHKKKVISSLNMPESAVVSSE